MTLYYSCAFCGRADASVCCGRGAPSRLRLSPCSVAQPLPFSSPPLPPPQAFIKRGNQTLIKLGDKEVDYNFDFKLYITTKLANPHYTPEISTKATIVNFAVKEQGLEAQLLNTVVKCERPDLDRQKNDLVVKVGQGFRGA